MFKKSSYKYAALLAVTLCPAPVLAQDLGVYMEVYGGARLATPVDAITANNDTEGSGVFGASIGLMTPIDGLAFELDFMRSKTRPVSDPLLGYEATTVMLNAEYSVHATDVIDVYAGVGLGSMSFVFSDGPSFQLEVSGAAYQVIVGGRAHLTENIAAFVEYKHDNTFKSLYGGANFRYPSHNVLTGLRFSF